MSAAVTSEQAQVLLRAIVRRLGLPEPAPPPMLAALEACATGLERVAILTPECRRLAARHIDAIMPEDASPFELGLALGLALALFSEPLHPALANDG